MFDNSLDFDVPSLRRYLAAWAQANYGIAATRVVITLEDGEKFNIPIRPNAIPPRPARSEENDFVPTEVQAEVLLALYGSKNGAMKTDELARACKTQSSRLFAKGRGIDQLITEKLVKHQDRLGYFLTGRGEAMAAELGEKRSRPTKPTRAEDTDDEE